MKLASLELFQALHDGSIWQSFLVLDGCDAAVLRRIYVVPACTRTILVLRGVESQANQATVLATPTVLCVTGGVRIRLNDGRRRWNQVQITSIEFLLKGLSFALVTSLAQGMTPRGLCAPICMILIDQLRILLVLVTVDSPSCSILT